MRIHRVYCPDISSNDREVVIEGQAASHLLRVLRIKTEQPIILFDGMGTEFQASIKITGRNRLTATIKSHANISRESPLNIHLVQGISRGERMDWVLQKATELGVTRITPVYTVRSVVALDEKRLKNWQVACSL